MKKNIPDWIPNWENPSEYPDPVTATPQEWAWEFLRRNDDYQQDYHDIYEGIKSIVPETIDLMKEAWGILKTSKEVEKHDLKERIMSIYCAIEYGEDFPRVFDLHREMEVKYKILVPFPGKLPDPSKKISSFEMFGLCLASMLMPGENQRYYLNDRKEIDAAVEKQFSEQNEARKIIADLAPNELTFSIDLTSNINSQLDTIKSIANNAQQKAKDAGFYKEARSSKKNASNYQLYLRSYDAHILHGVSTSEIAANLHPEIPNKDPDYHARKRVNNYIKTAKNLIRHDYKKFTLLPLTIK